MAQLTHPSGRRARRDLPSRPPETLGAGRRAGTPAASRGRHATSLGQGFGWLIGWTVIGTLLPGSGLLAAGRRVLGGLLLGTVALALAALAGLFLVGDPMRMAIRAAVSPQRLLFMAIAIAAVGLGWAVLVLLTHLALRRDAAVPNRAQSLAGAVLVLALVSAVGIPTYQLTSYSLIQRDLITSLFTSTDGPAPADRVRPVPEKPDPWASIPRVNVLLIGSDAGRDREGVRTDTLILASINTRTGDTVLFSLPRNLENVPFPIGSPAAQAWPNGFNCGDACLLNAIWSWGEANKARYYPKDKHPGLTATISGVEGALGLEVDYYAMVDLKGFQDVVDAIGGIRIDVPRRLPIGGGTSMSGTPLPIYGYIEPGKNKRLNGYKALWFARSRSGSDDYDRMRRQRCVIGAVVQQADPVELAKSFPKLARSAKKNIGTNIRLSDLEAWVDLTLRVKDGSVRSLPFTNSVINSANPDYALIHRLVNRALRDPAASSGSSGSDTSGTGTAGAGTAGAGTAGAGSSKKSTNPRVAQDVAAVC